MSSNAKRALYAAFAAATKAIGHEHRPELLELVAQAERTVERSGPVPGIDDRHTSQHGNTCAVLGW
jgi:hypothetical protein